VKETKAKSRWNYEQYIQEIWRRKNYKIIKLSKLAYSKEVNGVD
jgi:hypothetical protein